MNIYQPELTNGSWSEQYATSATDSPGYPDYPTLMPPNYSVTVLFTVVKSILTMICIGGNSLVIIAVATVSSLRINHPENSLIVSLAVSDLLVGIAVMPLSILHDHLGQWTLGPTFCSIWVITDVIACTSSILNLMTISVDRYLIITRPMAYFPRRTNRLMAIYITLAWVVSFVISVTPTMIGWKAEYSEYKCLMNQQVGYQLYATLGAFYIPLAVMLALYGKIYSISRQMRIADTRNYPSLAPDNSFRGSATPSNLDACQVPSSETVETDLCIVPVNEDASVERCNCCVNISEEDNAHVNMESNNNGAHYKHVNNGTAHISDTNTNNNVNQLMLTESTPAPLTRRCRSKQQTSSNQAISTLGVVMGTFTACWLPFFILALVSPICGDNCRIPDVILNLLTWLGYFNSCLNPLIYARFNNDFRTPFREILCCRCSTINTQVRQQFYHKQYGNG